MDATPVGRSVGRYIQCWSPWHNGAAAKGILTAAPFTALHSFYAAQAPQITARNKYSIDNVILLPCTSYYYDYIIIIACTLCSVLPTTTAPPASVGLPAHLTDTTGSRYTLRNAVQDAKERISTGNMLNKFAG